MNKQIKALAAHRTGSTIDELVNKLEKKVKDRKYWRTINTIYNEQSMRYLWEDLIRATGRFFGRDWDKDFIEYTKDVIENPIPKICVKYGGKISKGDFVKPLKSRYESDKKIYLERIGVVREKSENSGYFSDSVNFEVDFGDCSLKLGDNEAMLVRLNQSPGPDIATGDTVRLAAFTYKPEEDPTKDMQYEMEEEMITGKQMRARAVPGTSTNFFDLVPGENYVVVYRDGNHVYLDNYHKSVKVHIKNVSKAKVRRTDARSDEQIRDIVKATVADHFLRKGIVDRCVAVRRLAVFGHHMGDKKLARTLLEAKYIPYSEFEKCGGVMKYAGRQG